MDEYGLNVYFLRSNPIVPRDVNDSFPVRLTRPAKPTAQPLKNLCFSWSVSLAQIYLEGFGCTFLAAHQALIFTLNITDSTWSMGGWRQCSAKLKLDAVPSHYVELQVSDVYF